MSTPTPETLAERRALWTELRDRGGQDVILTPEFALALLDALAASEDAREEAERENADLLSPERDTTGLTYGDRRAWDDLCQRWKGAEARAVKAEQERDHLLETFYAACPTNHEHGVWCGSNWVTTQGRAESAVAAYAALVARIEDRAKSWSRCICGAAGGIEHAAPCMNRSWVAAELSALTEKEQDRG